MWKVKPRTAQYPDVRVKMKALRVVKMCILVVAMLSVVNSSPMTTTTANESKGEQGRGVGGIGFPSFFYDIKHQFGSIGHDLRKLVTSLLGATQVVYWKHPIQRNPLPPVRRADYYHRKSTTTVPLHPANRPKVLPTKKQRRKKAYTGYDYADFFSFDSLGLW